MPRPLALVVLFAVGVGGFEIFTEQQQLWRWETLQVYPFSRFPPESRDNYWGTPRTPTISNRLGVPGRPGDHQGSRWLGNGTAESRTLDPGPQPGVPGGGYQVSIWTEEDPPGTRFLREERRRTPSDRDMGFVGQRGPFPPHPSGPKGPDAAGAGLNIEGQRPNPPLYDHFGYSGNSEAPMMGSGPFPWNSYCALGCAPYLQGNGYCDTPCDNEACEFDHGDCEPREGTIGPTPIYHFNGTGERLDGDKYNYVQEQWAKADFDASPLEANDLRKHLRIGCYYINRVPNELVFQQCWDLLEEIVFDLELMENVSIFTPYNQTGVPCERTARVRYERDDDYVYGDMNPSQCITDCFLYDNMLYEESVSTSGGQEQTSALCQCLNDDWMAQYTLTEGYGDCSELVQVFREYDYRASIGNAQWDVARRYLYQVVMVQHPVKSIGRQHYIHAINAHENKPAWDFDYRLDRIIYNYV